MHPPSKKEALDYHSRGRKGKIEVVPSKPYSSQRDLSLAYSPGVAEPCGCVHLRLFNEHFEKILLTSHSSLLFLASNKVVLIISPE